jgi:hypothetical protein
MIICILNLRNTFPSLYKKTHIFWPKSVFIHANTQHVYINMMFMHKINLAFHMDEQAEIRAKKLSGKIVRPSSPVRMETPIVKPLQESVSSSSHGKFAGAQAAPVYL